MIAADATNVVAVVVAVAAGILIVLSLTIFDKHQPPQPLTVARDILRC